MNKLKPTEYKCVACGQPANRALVVVSSSTESAIPICQTCHVSVKTLPSHEQITLLRAKAYPPQQGEWWPLEGGAVAIGCPMCGAMTTTNPQAHTLESSGELKPSYICPAGCGLHAWITCGALGEGDET